ncbi:prevent-host-death family protein [Verrucomicrobiia bacterium DG1235]|nr:prevent-host-death family protein [Verrucomicrobiae bacterium DG1235]
MKISKTKLKAQMLSIFRTVERTGEEVVVTDRGKPTLKITRLPKKESLEDVFGSSRNAVVYNEDVMAPTTEEWPER